MRNFFFSLPRRFLNFSYVFKLALKLHWLADTQHRSAVYTTPCRCIDVLWHCNDVVCPLGRRHFLKKVVPSCSKCEMAFRFSKTLKNIYEGVQFSEVTGLLPATLLKIDSFIDMKPRFQRRIHKNLQHSFNLFD